jgi:hypothetical protein
MFANVGTGIWFKKGLTGAESGGKMIGKSVKNSAIALEQG